MLYGSLLSHSSSPYYRLDNGICVQSEEPVCGG